MFPQSDLSKLEALLMSGRSATALLQDFCKSPLRIEHIPAKAALRHSFPFLEKLALLVSSPENALTLSVRHVHIYGDGLLLLEAWNAFIPSLLPFTAQQKLTSTDIPFGALLGEHFFMRQALHTQPSAPPGPYRLTHQALLRRRADGKAFALVSESYTADAVRLCQTSAST